MSRTAKASHRLVEFQSEGATLRGWLYAHDATTRRPIVLMTHGFTATITGMVADRYAEVIHAAGLNVLLFDHLGFGLSGGEPRHVLNRWLQARGYRAAIDLACTLPSVDPSRIALWGDSLSGSVAIAVTSFDERVRALVVQVPACGQVPPPADPDGSMFRSLRESYFGGDVVSNPKDTIGPMAVVSHDQIGSPSLLAPITAFRWFIEYGGRPGTNWQNKATFVVPNTKVTYHAGLCSPHVRASSLWVIARDDEMEGAESHISRMCFGAVPGTKHILEVDGGHFGLLYHPSPLFDHVSAAQADFLVKQLAVSSRRAGSRRAGSRRHGSAKKSSSRRRS